jgi:hypothetical protein
MPNWCENRVTFTHEDPAQIKKIETAFKSDGGLFSGFFPVPEGYHEDGRWHGWCNANWGTKWDVNERDCCYIENDTTDPNKIQLYFETAWSPPIEFYQSMLELGFSISAYYFEPGMGFVGAWEDGCDECYDGFSHDIDGIVPAELVDMFNIHEWYDVEDEEQEADSQ